jgi:hypothetical protein
MIAYGEELFDSPGAWMKKVYQAAKDEGKRKNTRGGSSVVIEITYNGEWIKLFKAEDAVLDKAAAVPAAIAVDRPAAEPLTNDA